MAAYTKDEALTFIEAMRRTLTGKVGFSWFVERLSDLSAYIETITAENERLKAELESARAQDGSEPAGEPL
jgi:hypothetical protein